MEDGLSSVIPSNLAFDIHISTDHYEDEEAEAADALKREKQVNFFHKMCMQFNIL